MKKRYLLLAMTIGLALSATNAAQAKEDELVTLTGCVQGFAQGGIFLSDVVDKKGKIKHYLLVNDNEELKQHEGRIVEVVGTPAPIAWSVQITALDGRKLKTGSVFGVDELKSVQPSCGPVAQIAKGTN